MQRGFGAYVGVILMLGMALSATARAAEVLAVEAAGVSAWLFSDSAVPVVALSFRIEGGAATDPSALQGRSRLLADLLTEGAGPLDDSAFKKRLADLSANISFSATQDGINGALYTLSENLSPAADLLGLALTEPRFDEATLERARASQISSLESARERPSRRAYRAFLETAFANHPYARSVRGRVSTLAKISADDLKLFVAQHFGRDRLTVTAAGDIDEAALQDALIRAFGKLPAEAAGGQADLTQVALPQKPLRLLAAMPTPQSTIVFGGPGIRRVDPDWRAAALLSEIMGGGFGARLMEEVREKRGLVYSISAGLTELDAAALILGSASTSNATVGETVKVVEAEWARMADEGPTAEELADAKSYVIGSLPLALDSTTAIADALLSIRLNDLPKDYMDQRTALIEAVSLDDVQRVAKRLFNPDRLTIAVAGAPEASEGWRPITVADDD
jgi:zinc protease